MAKKRSRHKDKRVRMFEGLPVVDADHDVDVTITEADVKAAKKKDPGMCAAAVAGRRELKQEVKVFMSRMYVKDAKRKRWTRYVTPGNMSREIVSFDRGSQFEPGEYEFKAPSKGQRLGSYTHRRPEHNGSHPKKKNHVTANVRISAKEGWR